MSKGSATLEKPARTKGGTRARDQTGGGAQAGARSGPSAGGARDTKALAADMTADLWGFLSECGAFDTCAPNARSIRQGLQRRAAKYLGMARGSTG